MSRQYETVIGLEVHVELATKTKIFCGCSTEFGGAPNTHTCPVCTGMPGSLPVLNKQVVEYAAAVGLATNCTITQNCKFDRKNYFYPDNPQNYQISQLYYPICRDGHVEIEVDGRKKNVGIHEIHMEEDAGKLIHDPATGNSLVDFNRSGVPLIEIVSEPDMRSAEEVIAYLEKLRMIIQYLGASDCKLQEGSMRADVNLSVREVGAETFGTRTEMKNLNSFSAIARAIEGERERQIDLLEEGKEVVQETRRWDDEAEYSYPMRSKEDAQDYRYFPEPDLPPIVISDAWLEEIRAKQPEFRDENHERGWLLLTAKNVCRDMLRAWWRRQRVGLDELPEPAAPAADGEIADLLDALLALPEKHRVTLYLYYWEGYPAKDVAALLGCRESTVRTRLQRGRDMLKQELGGDLYDEANSYGQA